MKQLIIPLLPFLQETHTPAFFDKLITYLSPQVLLSTYEKMQKTEGKFPVKGKELISQLQENSNPVIIQAYIKK